MDEQSEELRHPSTEFRDLLVSHFDESFYLDGNPDVAASGQDPLDHFLSFGWKEFRRPNPDFDTAYYLDANPDVREQGINPLVHFVQIGWKEGRRQNEPPPPPDVDQDVCDAIREHFDADYYLDNNPDVRASGFGALEHFVAEGWREGRNPCANFETLYYLSDNPDIAGAGTNPFLHYIQRGHHEGRLPRHPIPAPIRAVLYDIQQYPETAEPADTPAIFARTGLDLESRLTASFGRSRGRVVVSFSHDSYTENTGGIQIFIADEQRLFNDAGTLYLNVSPVLPMISTSNVDDPEKFVVQITEDGECWDPVSMASFGAAVSAARGAHPDIEITIVIHSLLGHNMDLVQEFCESIDGPRRSFLWLHDYFTLCPSYSLMRNAVTSCGAPDPGSAACSVCAYGESRKKHLAQMEEFFESQNFTVIAPSQTALDLWTDRGDLPVESTVVCAHADLVFNRKRIKHFPSPSPSGECRKAIKVAYCGYPDIHKGWYVYQSLLDEFANDPRYQFYHFCKSQSGDRRPKFREVRVSGEDRHAMTAALKAEDIDLVVIPALWPETFCYVAHEAAAAGCVIATLESSGNVRAFADSLEQGRVFKDEAAILAAFEDGSLDADVRKLLERGIDTPEVQPSGTTATHLKVVK